MKRFSWSILPFFALAMTACDGGAAGGSLLARAAGHEFTVPDATRLLASQPGIPNQAEVVMALSDLWIDYTLLAVAAAEDSALSGIDLDPLLQQQEEMEMIGTLRDSVIQVDSTVSDEELRRRFMEAAPGVRVRARHILLAPPDLATEEQRDSVREQGEALLRRIQEGENFADLAREHSQDPGSAAQGGDLGFFERGQMVAAFDSAAFSLEPGEVSDLVATPYGFHIIQVEEKETPGFEDVAEEFRTQLQSEKLVRAESTYVAGVIERGGVEIQEGAVDATREIARNPLGRMSGRASRRELATFAGGGLTVQEVRAFMQTRQPGYRQQVEQATDEQIRENVLMALVQRELLVDEARAAGITPPPVRDSVAEVIRTNFADAARQLGLVDITRAEGESRDEAIDRAVLELLQSILRGERDVVPLGAIAFTLRRQYSAELFQPSVDVVVQRVAEARGPGAPPSFEMPPSAPPQPGDTTASAPAGG